MPQARSNHMESKSCGESITKKANEKDVQEHVARDLRQQFDAVQTETQHTLHEKVALNTQNRNPSKSLDGPSRDAFAEFYPNEGGRRDKRGPTVSADRGLLAHQNTSPTAFPIALEHMHAPGCTNGHAVSGTVHLLKNKNERMGKHIQSCGKQNIKPKITLESDFQKISERDDRSHSEWNSVNGSRHLGHSDMPLLYSEQKGSVDVQAQAASCEEFLQVRLFSPANENVSSWREISNGTKSSSKVCSRGHLTTNSEDASFLSSDRSSSAVAQLKVSPDSNVGKCCNKCLEKK